MDALLTQKEKIEQTLNELHEEFADQFSFHPWANDAFKRVFEFSKKGKLLRGALVIQGAEMAGHTVDTDVLRVAAAMELVHSALLIHDDIMDNDILRRGEPSIYYQYQLMAKDNKISDPESFGRNMGICIGDIIYFVAFQVISQLKTKHKNQLFSFLSKELITVGFGEMQDVSSYSNSSIQEILTLYKYKTGRYSFALPLLLGTTIAGKAALYQRDIFTFGETVGPLFQIVDDKIGLLGTELEVGKTLGSDVKEGRRTLYMQMLLSKVNSTELNYISGLKGKKVTPRTLSKIHIMLEKYNILSELSQIERDLMVSALSQIEDMAISVSNKNRLSELVRFVALRNY